MVGKWYVVQCEWYYIQKWFYIMKCTFVETGNTEDSDTTLEKYVYR